MAYGMITVIVAAGLWILAAPNHTLASSSASFYFSEPVALAEEGMFSVDVLIATEHAAVNAAEGSIAFDENLLNIVDVSFDRSAFRFWVTEPTVTHATGTEAHAASSTIDFLGGSIIGYHGMLPIMTVTFQALSGAPSELVFASGGIYAADGYGTNVTSGMDAARRLVGAPPLLGT